MAQQTKSGLGGFDVLMSHTIRHTRGSTPLNEWSARRRCLCLHNTSNSRTSMTSSGFEHAMPAIKRFRNMN